MKTIRELRKEQGIKATQMAEMLGLAINSYFDKEVGNRKFKPHEIVILCKFFNVRVEEVKNFYKSFPRCEDISITTA